MTEQDFQQILRKNTYTSEPVKRELFNPLLQMEDNRVLQAAHESKLSPENLQIELQQIVYMLEHNSFIPLKETKSIGAIAGIEEGRIIPQPLPIEDIRAELDAKYNLAVKLYGQDEVEKYAQQTNQRVMEVLDTLPVNPDIVANQDNIYLSLPKTILDDQSIMIPVINFMMAAKLRPLAGLENPKRWTDPYSSQIEVSS
ncbi:MAG TPA: hypothetical protein PLS49_07025 [Candidatus Woesebacteria bacterium]|nr:hypothetical protein [Candidatus Woesebacteria bacterium]